MNNIIVVIATGNQPYYRHTLPELERLADFWSCDFLKVTRPGSHRFPAQSHSKIPVDSWLKIDRLANLDRYDRIITLDADILPVWRNVTGRHFLELCKGDIAWAPDQGQPTGSDEFRKWAGSYFAPGLWQPGEAPYFNGGVVSYSPKAALVLTEWMDNADQYPSPRFLDQDFLNGLYRYEQETHQTGLQFHELEQSWNWHKPEVHKVARLGKLIHFAGDKSLIETYIANDWT